MLLLAEHSFSETELLIHLLTQNKWQDLQTARSVLFRGEVLHSVFKQLWKTREKLRCTASNISWSTCPTASLACLPSLDTREPRCSQWCLAEASAVLRTQIIPPRPEVGQVFQVSTGAIVFLVLGVSVLSSLGLKGFPTSRGSDLYLPGTVCAY